MKQQLSQQSEASDSRYSSFSSVFSDAKSLLKEISVTSASIGTNLTKSVYYTRKMRENEALWRVQCTNPVALSWEEFKRLQLYARYYNVLYGDPTNPSFFDKALNYVQLNFGDEDRLYYYIIYKFQQFGVTSFTCSNFKQNGLYYPVFVVFELEGVRYVVIRGTYSLRDVMADSFGIPIEINGYWVHGGFARSAQFLLDRVGNCFCGQDVVVIGHSYGAAIGAILSHVIRKDVRSVRTYLYGCPPCYSPSMIRAQSDITTVIYGQDPVPRMGLYGLAAFDFRLASSNIEGFYDRNQMFETITKGGFDPAQIMLVPGNIVHMVPTIDYNGQIERVDCFKTDCRDYLEFVLVGLGKMMKDHTCYLQALAVCLNEPRETPISVDSDAKSDDDISFFQRLFKK